MHGRDQDVFIDGEFGKDGRDLEGPSNPFPGDLMGGEAGNIFPLEKDLPICRGMDTGEEVKKSGLPGPVRADNRFQLSGFDGKIYIMNRYERAEGDS